MLHSTTAFIPVRGARYFLRSEGLCLQIGEDRTLQMKKCFNSDPWVFEHSRCGYYWIRSRSGRCAASNDPRKGPAFVAACKRVSGQLWRSVRAKRNAYFTLVTMSRESISPAECLHGGAKGAPAYMALCKPHHGQLFWAQRVG